MAQEHEAKRRKVRKGTQSCWECRRRKVRCVFPPHLKVCRNCKRRGTECVSQDCIDQPPPLSGGNHVEARVTRLEGLIGRVVGRDALQDRPDREPVSERQQDTPETEESVTRTSSVPITPSADYRGSGKYEDLCGQLVAVWPGESDLKVICTVAVGLSAYVNCAVCIPFPISEDQPQGFPGKMLQLPPPPSHPVLIARKLLMLAVFLQAVPPSSIPLLDGLGRSYRDIMDEVAHTAIRLVTTNDELIGCVEAIECIMLESFYQNYAGHLHRSWMAIRRAVAMAQMLGLHRGLSSPSLKFLDPESRNVFHLDRLCFRLLEMDRYLCLMLGLPPASFEVSLTTPAVPGKCQPAERMRRIHCEIAGRILQRTHSDDPDLATTLQIDALLQKAADEMPPQWWLAPGLTPSTDPFTDTVRLMDQFGHFHLFIRLHLPYMLCSSSDPDPRYAYSRIAAVNASRETLSRYIAFRTSNPAHFYCRGSDLLAFVATVVMSLAHIDARRRGGEPCQLLAHSRLSDRGLMERTLEVIRETSGEGDLITSKLTRIIQPLLGVEARSATGVVYTTSASRDNDRGSECDAVESASTLRISIPYFGTINFEHGQPVPAAVEQSQMGASIAPPDRFLERLSDELLSSTCQINPAENIQHFPFFDPSASDGPLDIMHSGTHDIDLSPGWEDGWDLQGIDVALFDSLFGTMGN